MSPEPSFLATRRGKLTLAFLCGVAFLDFVDASIVNVALPSIQHSLHFSIQSLQWVLSGYLLTYGGFMLLGGRAADLIGRRRVLVAGTALFGLASLTAGLAGSEGMLIGARLAQGIGAAMMIPAALSILTTSFSEGSDRNTAIGAWGATAGLASALGVFLGGVISQGSGLALGVLREPAGLRAGPDRGLPAGPRRTASAAPGPLRRARGAARDHRDAALDLRDHQGPRRRLGEATHDRRAGRCRRAARRVRPQRVASRRTRCSRSRSSESRASPRPTSPR